MEWRKVTRFSQIVAIVLALIIFALGIWIGMEIEKGNENAATNMTPQATTTEESTGTVAGADGVTCHTNSQFMIAEKSRNPNVGTDFLVMKNMPGMPCEYTATSDSFEISNADEADYFLALTGHYLVLDEGTGPDPRGLIVYDLNAKEKVYSGQYAKPFSAEGDKLTFWLPTTDVPTADNCPDLAQYTQNGLGAIIEAQTTLDLSTLSKVSLGEMRCEPMQ
jgi:hypothetical protein